MENKKKLPRPIYLAIFLFVLGVVCAGLLSVVHMVTIDKINQNELEAEEKANQEIVDFLVKDLAATDVINITNDVKEHLISERKNKVNQIFKFSFGESKAYALKVYEQNDFTEFYTLVVLKQEESNFSVLRVKVLETKGYQPTSLGSSKNNLFFDDVAANFGLAGSSINDTGKNFVSVAGSTFSANCVLKAVNTSFSQMDNLVKGGLYAE